FSDHARSEGGNRRRRPHAGREQDRARAAEHRPMTAHRHGYVKVHPGVVRATHWINVVAIAIMIGSGWRIWNSSPIFDFSFPVAIRLGGDRAMAQDGHNDLGLAGALQWHFAGMWLLAVNGLVYFIYGIWSSHFRTSLFPVGPSAFIRDALAALSFRLP